MNKNVCIEDKWLELLDSSEADPDRLDRGLDYAKSGMVRNLRFDTEAITASVKGSYGRSYDVKIELPPLDEEEIVKVKKIIDSNSEIDNETLIELIPDDFENLYVECDCPDWETVCKHIAAVFYEVADEIGKNPSLLLKLRGFALNSTNNEKNIFEKYLDEASHETLRILVKKLVKQSGESYRKALDFLEEKVELDVEAEQDLSAEKFMSVWDEIKWDLKKAEEYGLDEYDQEYRNIDNGLFDIKEELEKKQASKTSRKEFIDEGLSYLTGNGSNGFENEIFDALQAACYEEDELRYLAENLEDSGSPWISGYAMQLYKNINDKEKYLEIRYKNLIHGRDYYDLTLFYEEAGEHNKAVKTAYEGLEKADGWSSSLREFLIKTAQDNGNRQEFLRLKFEQTTARFNIESYLDFKNTCTPEEWQEYEPKILESLNKAWTSTQIEIRLERQEYEKVLNLLLSDVDTRYKRYTPGTDTVSFNAAEKLETMYPKEIVKFYIDYLGDTDSAKDRKQYAAQAKIAVKIKNTYENILKTPEKWVEFAKDIKYENKNRKAFQEEFGKVVKGWKSL